MTIDINAWCQQTVLGSGGFLSKLSRESCIELSDTERDLVLEAVEFTVRALGNRRWADSKEVAIEALLRHFKHPEDQLALRNALADIEETQKNRCSRCEGLGQIPACMGSAACPMCKGGLAVY